MTSFVSNRLTAHLVIGIALIGCLSSDDTFQSVVEGKPVVIECGVEDSQHTTVHWNHNNKPMVYDSRRFQRNGDLVIVYALRVKDFGQFGCLASNDMTGHTLQQTIELKVFWLSEVVKVSQHSEAITQDSNGMDIILNCESVGNPEPRIDWFLNSIKIHETQHLTVSDNTLKISKASVALNGVYSCRASNSAAKVESIDNFELKIEGEGVPHLEQISKNSIVKLNSNITMDCMFTNAASIEWYSPKKDVPLVNTSRITVFPNGSVTIERVEREDSGVYRCVGLPFDNKHSDKVQTYSTRLQTAYLDEFDSNHMNPIFVPNLKTHVIPRNSSQMELFCVPPNGIPKPRVWWEEPNGDVISDTGRVRVDENSLIIVGPLKKSDSGNYTCVVNNMAAQKKKHFEIFVAIAPTLTDPNSIIADEDGIAVLHCVYTASPYTSHKWLKDGKYMRSATTHNIHNNGSLVIKRAQMTDSGEYQCEINSTGFLPIRSKAANLTIRERIKFLNIPNNKNLELNSNAKLICKAKGGPVLTVKWVKWTKEGQILGLEWPKHIHDSNGTLHFNGVKREDAGNYTCVATNAQGFINTSIEVLVTIRPKFVVEPKPQTIDEGFSTVLHCRAEGEPNPSIQWDKDNVLNGFDTNRFTVMTNGSLHINEVLIEDSGKYGCTAGNSGGFNRTEVTLTVNSADIKGFTSEENVNKMTRTVAITLGAAALYMFLVMALMIYCRYRRAKRKAITIARTADQNKTGDLELKERNKNIDNPEQHRLLTTADDKQKPIINKNHIRSEGDIHSQTSSTQSSKRSKSPFERLQICRQDLQKLCLLGHGEFGDVFLAKANFNNNKFVESGQIVLVKALQSKDENIIFDYKREIEMFHKLNHERIVRLIGLVRDIEPFLFVLEYSDWGDLKQFLLATRDDNSRPGPKPTPLTLPQVIGIAQQIAFAMEYMTNNRFVHKDLSTRNCLITSKLDIKISSTSLSKDTYSAEYFHYQNRDLPIRWAPHEAVIEDEWSAKSDVYSFGVIIWEMFFKAELPFPEMSDTVVIRLLKKTELHLEPPEPIPHLLRDLLLSCWSTSPKDRPTFTDVCHILNKILLNIRI